MLNATPQFITSLHSQIVIELLHKLPDLILTNKSFCRYDNYGKNNNNNTDKLISHGASSSNSGGGSSTGHKRTIMVDVDEEEMDSKSVLNMKLYKYIESNMHYHMRHVLFPNHKDSSIHNHNNYDESTNAMTSATSSSSSSSSSSSPIIVVPEEWIQYISSKTVRLSLARCLGLNGIKQLGDQFYEAGDKVRAAKVYFLSNTLVSKRFITHQTGLPYLEKASEILRELEEEEDKLGLASFVSNDDLDLDHQSSSSSNKQQQQQQQQQQKEEDNYDGNNRSPSNSFLIEPNLICFHIEVLNKHMMACTDSSKTLLLEARMLRLIEKFNANKLLYLEATTPTSNMMIDSDENITEFLVLYSESSYRIGKMRKGILLFKNPKEDAELYVEQFRKCFDLCMKASSLAPNKSLHNLFKNILPYNTMCFSLVLIPYDEKFIQDFNCVDYLREGIKFYCYEMCGHIFKEFGKSYWGEGGGE
jgi:hypothetical protein